MEKKEHLYIHIDTYTYIPLGFAGYFHGVSSLISLVQRTGSLGFCALGLRAGLRAFLRPPLVNIAPLFVVNTAARTDARTSLSLRVSAYTPSALKYRSPPDVATTSPRLSAACERYSGELFSRVLSRTRRRTAKFL